MKKHFWENNLWPYIFCQDKTKQVFPACYRIPRLSSRSSPFLHFPAFVVSKVKASWWNCKQPAYCFRDGVFFTWHKLSWIQLGQSWFSEEAGWADPNRQSNGIFYFRWGHAQYFSGELAEGGAFAAQEQAEHRVVRTLHVAGALGQYYWLLFSSPFAMLLNCSHPKPWVFCLFPSDSPPHPTGMRE